MRNQGMAIIGGLIMLAGVVLLIGNIFNFNIWAVCFPLGLILLGVFVLLRPRMVAADTASHIILIGDLERGGQWALAHEEIWSFVVDANFDLTKADIPPGETVIRAFSFVGDFEIYAPAEVGVALDLASFVTTLKIDGQKEEDSFLSPVHWRSEAYKAAERRVRFELTQFVGDIKLRRF
ncbi:cell wall-active antibiotics response protein LiaF [Promineifilum sp.]|uniref:cell wall-active antibiotics response protein LiaF n=1 Tax=Promineifilum sp. TaxID=2664178 RepID=UPI0035B4F623